jgi:capsular exopolysaccharide synthesis family protein
MGDGKTCTALNLVGILAHDPATRVLLVEADLRHPTIASYLGIRPHRRQGLVEALLDPTLPLERVVQHYRAFNFALLPAGRSFASPYDLLRLPRFGELLDEARRYYDLLIVDTPPLIPFADCRVIERWVDGFLVVVAAHKTPRKLVEEAIAVLDPAKLVGLVFNKDDYQSPKYYRAYGYYG